MANQARTLIDVKRALAAKYESLAKQTGSKPKQKNWHLRAKRYRDQVAVLEATSR